MSRRESRLFERVLCSVVTVTGRPLTLVVLQIEKRLRNSGDVGGRVGRWEASKTAVPSVCREA